jgi:hypothetical protein
MRGWSSSGHSSPRKARFVCAATPVIVPLAAKFSPCVRSRQVSGQLDMGNVCDGSFQHHTPKSISQRSSLWAENSSN